MNSQDGMFLRRPTSEETDEDLLNMQKNWQSGQKASVEIKRVKRKGKPENKQQPKQEFSRHGNEGARFTIDLEKICEENSQQVLFPVVEKNDDWLQGNKQDDIARSGFLKYSKDDGFPEPLDLSAYYKATETKRTAPVGKSFFAAEFDRVHGIIDVNLDEAACSTVEQVEEAGEDFATENDRYISKLNMEQVNELKKEIEERLNPKLIEFLASRRKKKEDKPQPKVSRFKARREAEKIAQDQEKKGEEAVKTTGKETIEIKEIPPPGPSSEPPPSIVQSQMLDELEVLDEFINREDREKYDRLATDAVQLDFAAKFGKNIASRQHKNAIRLFESCKFRPDDKKDDDKLVELARSEIDNIKMLYLEEVLVDGAKRTEFAVGVNPILDGCWTLVPVRKVVDAVEKRNGIVSADDVEIVRLSLLWSVLLFEERKSAFYAFADPSEIFVRLAEVFVIGSEVLADDVIVDCVDRLVKGYVIKAALDGRLCLRMNSKVAGLDAFMPFYEDLLKNYEQFSLGNVQFTTAILVFAYLNSAIGDSLECQFALWTPRRQTIRQMTTRLSQTEGLFDNIRHCIDERAKTIDEQYYVQHTSLLSAYAAAIRDEIVTRERNELVFSIAAYELGSFVARHTSGQHHGTVEQRKHIDFVVEAIRKTVKDKLDI